MKFNPGFDIEVLENPMGFNYGPGVSGPVVENRTLNSIRKSLMDSDSDGPEIVYTIAMDVYKNKHLPILEKMNLLYGVVSYAKGSIGREPVRSQGHIHTVSPFCGCSTPEVYEIWSGKAIIYMQESAEDNPGRCFAVEADPGEVVIVPPGWAHATISADSSHPLTFGAWCVRDFGFEYAEVRAHSGLSWFPVLDDENKIGWKRNKHYNHSELVEKKPEIYSQLNINPKKSIYRQFEENPEKFWFVARPQVAKEVWENFIP